MDAIDALVASWRASGLEPELVARMELGKRCVRLGDLLTHELRAALAQFELTTAEFDVLAALLQAGRPYRRKPGELTRMLFLTSGGTSNVLQRLVNAGRVTRQTDSTDARSRWVQLTESGRILAEQASTAAAQAHTAILSGASLQAVQQATDALREIATTTTVRRHH